MQITLNDRNLPEDFSHLGNLEEVLAEIHAHHLPPGQQLYQVHLNGQFFSERYPRESRYLGINEIERLEVKTISDQRMAQVILQEAVGQAEILSQAIVECARLFRVAPEAEGNRGLAQVLEALRWLLQTGESGWQVLAQGRPAQANGLQGMPRFLKDLQVLLTEMEEMAREEDYIMLADLMEYELHPLVEQWRTLITALARS